MASIHPTNQGRIKTQAYVSRGPHHGEKLFELEDVFYEGGVGEKEVLVEILAVGVCHSDVKAAEGRFHMKPPLICGHEGSGVGELRILPLEGSRMLISGIT